MLKLFRKAWEKGIEKNFIAVFALLPNRQGVSGVLPCYMNNGQHRLDVSWSIPLLLAPRYPALLDSPWYIPWYASEYRIMKWTHPTSKPA